MRILYGYIVLIFSVISLVVFGYFFIPFGDVLTELISDTEIDFTYVDLPRDWANYYYTAVGWIISFIGLGISKKPNYTFLNKSWKGEGWTKVRLSWDP